MASAWLILIAALLVQIAVANIIQGIPTLAPFLQADLELSNAQVGLLNSYIFGGFVIGSVPMGYLSDRLGSRVMLIGGSALIGVLALLTGWLIGGGWRFSLALVLIGLIGSVAVPAGTRAVARAFPTRRRGLALSLRQTGVPLGGALAAATLPGVALATDWRTATLVAGGVALLASLVCALLYWLRPRDTSKTYVPPPDAGADTPKITRDLLLVSVAGSTLPVGQFIMITYLILFLRDALGIPELTGAALLTTAQLLGAGSRVFFSALSDRFSGRRKPLLLMVVAATGLGAFTLGQLSADTPLPLVVTVVLVYGACVLGWQGLYFTLISELSPPGFEGRSVGFSLIFTSLGILSGPPLFGLVVDTTGSYRLAWQLLAVVLAVGVSLLSLVREPERKDA
ncbi:MAG: MFS transporter [Trueperaceae bacterium]|nr:MFS transporter [Trueperaceae bacterium]